MADRQASLGTLLPLVEWENAIPKLSNVGQSNGSPQTAARAIALTGYTRGPVYAPSRPIEPSKATPIAIEGIRRLDRVRFGILAGIYSLISGAARGC